MLLGAVAFPVAVIAVEIILLLSKVRAWVLSVSILPAFPSPAVAAEIMELSLRLNLGVLRVIFENFLGHSLGQHYLFDYYYLI